MRKEFARIWMDVVCQPISVRQFWYEITKHHFDGPALSAIPKKQGTQRIPQIVRTGRGFHRTEMDVIWAD